MKQKRAPFRGFGLAILAAIGGWLLFRFIDDPNGSGTAVLDWNESVQLTSGQTVQIKRHAKFTQNYMWGVQMMSAQQYYESSIEMDPSQKDFVRWEAPLQPLYLDRDPGNGEWLIIAGEDGNFLWAVNGQPCPPQWAFRLRDGVWYLQALPGSLLGRKPNLLVDLRIKDDHRLSHFGFQGAVAQRKADQLGPSGRISAALESVGANYSLRKYCKDVDTPRFTREFIPKASNQPNIANFPRMLQ
jgi:hypothetical protein